MNGRSHGILNNLNQVVKDKKEKNITKSTVNKQPQFKSSNTSNQSTSTNNAMTPSSKIAKIMSSDNSDSSSSNTDSQQSSQQSSSVSNSDIDNDSDEIADIQIQEAQSKAQDAKIEAKLAQSSNNNNNSNTKSNSNSTNDSEDPEAEMQKSNLKQAEQNFKETPDEQNDDNADAQITALANSNASSSNSSSVDSSSSSISASDPATTQQGQKNLAKNEKAHQPDLQDITSPNLFIVRARNFHNRMTKLLDKYAYNDTKTNKNIINLIISLEDESFQNLCNGFSLIIEDNNRRNNEVEARTEHLQKQAMDGAKTIKLWQNEGIFANLKDELGELSDVLHDPRFQAFAQHTKTASLNIPKTLKVKGKQATENVNKANAQKQSKGGKNDDK